MRNWYFFALVAATVATFLLNLPNVSLVVLVMTLGIAAPLILPMPMVCLCLWAALPSVVLADFPRWRIWSRVFSICVVGLVILGPGFIADWEAAADVASREIAGRTPETFKTPIGIEIVRPAVGSLGSAASENKPDIFLQKQPCFDLCERLLTGGNVAWIRLILTRDMVGASSGESRAFLTPGAPGQCQEIDGDFSPDQRCALFSADTGAPADLTLVLTEKTSSYSRLHSLTPYVPSGYRSASAYRGAVRAGVAIFHLEQVFYERPFGFLGFNVGSLGGGDRGGGFMWDRKLASTDPIELTSALQDLGLPLGPVRTRGATSAGAVKGASVLPTPNAQDAAYVASLLSTGPEMGYDYSGAYALMIGTWYEGLESKEKLTAADKSIFCASLQDHRFSSSRPKDEVMSKHKIVCS
jgi:energy-coupling factor transporter transmembrane protein EcfT